MPPVFRFAPSPNGLLHLGHAYSALLNQDLARRVGGKLLLRIEDIDPQRCREEWVTAMLEDLAWLGLDFDAPRRQSKHFADYKTALDRLANLGLLYRSYASRNDIDAAVLAEEKSTGRSWPRDPDGAPLYPRARLAEQAGAAQDGHGPFALRLDMARALACVSDLNGQANLNWQECRDGQWDRPRRVTAAPRRWGDVVLARKDSLASYHIAVVVDDALQGVTHVVRGRDLFHATSIHRLLQRLLGLPAPLYYHHPLLRDDEGQKLSKSLASQSLRSLRAEGATLADILNLFSFKK